MAHGGATRSIDTAVRDAQCARMRVEGLTYREISDHWGWAGPSAAHQAVKRALKDAVKDSAEALIAFEDERFDTLLSKVMILVNSDDPYISLAAMDRALKISSERRKMYGVDAPAKSEVKVTSSLESEIEALVNELAGNEPSVDVTRVFAPEEVPA